MATVSVVMALVGGKGIGSDRYPAYIAWGAQSESVTSSGTSAQSTNKAKRGMFARIVSDGAIWATAGENPTAAAGDWYIPAGAVLDLQVEPGDKVAVIDA